MASARGQTCFWRGLGVFVSRTSEVAPASRSTFDARSEGRAPTSVASRTEGTRLSGDRQLTASPRVPGRRPKHNRFGKSEPEETSERRKVQEERFFVVVFARRGRLFVRFLAGRRGYQGGFSPDGEVTREIT